MTILLSQLAYYKWIVERGQDGFIGLAQKKKGEQQKLFMVIAAGKEVVGTKQRFRYPLDRGGGHHDIIETGFA